MLKIAFATLLMALLSCGAGDTNQGASTTAGDLPPVSTIGATIGEVPIPEIEELAAGALEIQSCLDLVAGGDFTNAVPVCLEAAGIAPESAEVQAALEEAQAKVATSAATAAAQSAAAGAIPNPGVKLPTP